MGENSFYFDGSLCVGCRGCQVACKQWHDLAAEKTEFFAAPGGYQNPRSLSAQTWTILKFFEVSEGGSLQWFFRRDHCFHCTNAACIEVCPAEPKAMMRHPEFKTVYVNQERCIGCGACEQACPHGAPHLSDTTGTARKCEGCYDRAGAGLLPACVRTCPTGSIQYGPKDEVYAGAQARAAALRKQGFPDANVYGPEQNGGLHSICVLPARLEVYGLAKEPKMGDLDGIRRKAQERYAAWKLESRPVCSQAGLGPAACVGAVVASLRRFAERKEAVRAAGRRSSA